MAYCPSFVLHLVLQVAEGPHDASVHVVQAERLGFHVAPSAGAEEA